MRSHLHLPTHPRSNLQQINALLKSLRGFLLSSTYSGNAEKEIQRKTFFVPLPDFSRKTERDSACMVPVEGVQGFERTVSLIHFLPRFISKVRVLYYYCNIVVLYTIYYYKVALTSAK